MAAERVRRPPRRTDDLREILEAHKTALLDQMRARMRLVRSTEGGERGVFDQQETVDSDGQSELSLALLQMQSETLGKVETALGRLASGDYGNCRECGEAIAVKRLRALPFAARCRDCEEEREREAAARRAAPAAESAFDRLR